MQDILRRELRKYGGLRQQLDRNLLGDDGETWERELKKFLRKESCWGGSVSLAKPVNVSTIEVPNLKNFSKEEIMSDSELSRKIDFDNEDSFWAFMTDVDEGQISSHPVRVCRMDTGKFRADPKFLNAGVPISDVFWIIKNRPKSLAHGFWNEWARDGKSHGDEAGCFRALVNVFFVCGLGFPNQVTRLDLSSSLKMGEGGQKGRLRRRWTLKFPVLDELKISRSDRLFLPVD